jgi:hypothetical protein
VNVQCNGAVLMTQLGALLFIAALAGCGEEPRAAVPTHPASDGETLGFVLSRYDYLFYQTPGAKEECPHGFAPTNREQWEAQFPTAEQRRAHLSRCLATTNRGPDCENVWIAPEAINDPLPFRAVEGKHAFGMDLDGADGTQAADTCAHEEFTSPDGTTGIDNQYYRFLGCDRFVQGGQHHSPQNDKARTAQYQVNRVLLEVSGVDDEVNDDSVDVAIYRGKDPLLVDAMEVAVPWQSQRVDETIPPIHVRGKIVDRTLVTEPADVFWEGLLFERRLLLRDMTLHLTLGGVHARGLRVGYVDAERLWRSYVNTSRWGGNIYGASGPAAYRALYELADGFKDPTTGRCTALSSAREYDFVRAYVIHPEAGMRT